MKHPVLIAGAGPAGLVAAITLARMGVSSLLVERRPNVSTAPRATGISTRTMEIMRSWGLEARVRRGDIGSHFHGRMTPTLMSSEGMSASMGFPTPEEVADLSPTRAAAVPQDHLEPVLVEHLGEHPCAEIRWGTEVLGLSQDGDGVEVTLREASTGEISTVRAAYVVGADGAHSTVRAALGIAMTGPERMLDNITVHFRAPLREVAPQPLHGIYMITNPEAPGVLLPVSSADRWMYSFQWDPDTETLAEYGQERLTRLIATATGVPEVKPVIERVGFFSFTAQIADRYSQGRCFLIGDAAHKITPRGGTGMNTAIHDGFDLGWKLAWVLRRWAVPSLLDTYEVERRPVGARNTARSAEVTGGRRPISEVLAEDLGGRMPHVWVTPGVSTLDLLGRGFTLFTGPVGAWRREGRSKAPLDIHTLGVEAARALGLSADGALLARPDGQVVACWASAAADPQVELDTAMEAMRHGLVGV